MTNIFQTFLNYQFLGNSGKSYLTSLLIFLILLVVLRIFRQKIFFHLKERAKKTKTEIDDILIEIIEGVKPPFYFFISLYFALYSLKIPEKFQKIINSLFILIIVYQIIKSFHISLNRISEKIAQKEEGKEKLKKEASLKGLFFLIKIVIWTIAALIILSSWGINVNSLIAGLGIGGIAVALAIQNILGDIFSSFSLIFDKPFEIGDFIVVGSNNGIVKKIGIKTTRI